MGDVDPAQDPVCSREARVWLRKGQRRSCGSADSLEAGELEHNFLYTWDYVAGDAGGCGDSNRACVGCAGTPFLDVFYFDA